MLVLAPESVEFEGESWPAVELISIDRTPMPLEPLQEDA